MEVDAKQRHFDCLIACIDQIVLILNESAEVTHVSAGSADWLVTDELLGRTFTKLFPEDLAPLVAGQLGQAKVKASPVRCEYNLRPDHAFHWHELGLTEQRTWDTSCQQIEQGQFLFVIADRSEEMRLERKVNNQAQRDPLTGAFNRRALMTVLSQSVAQAQRYDWVCSFLVIDIDHFSNVNDDHGWDAGDLILQHLVTSLHGFKRTADFLARYSDDKFVMFLPETNRDQAKLAAERIRKMAEELEIPYSKGDLNFTVSIGASTLRDLDDTPEAMLKRAEENLFVAKQSGSNRVEVEVD